MFELETVAGSVQDALAEPGRLALREDVANLLNDESVAPEALLGRMLSISYNGVARDYQVAAVYRMPDRNTVLELPVLTRLDDSVLPTVYRNWGALTIYSYVRLRAGTGVAALASGLDAFVERNAVISGTAQGGERSAGDMLRLDLQAIGSIHLDSPFDDSRDGGNRNLVIAFTAIAVLVLLVATINFTILSTARASNRAGEAAIRLSVGAGRGELIRQFLGESFCIVLPALLLSCVLVELLLPVFEAMVGKTLIVDWFAVDTIAGMALVYLAVSLLGGLYPALLLSHFRPSDILRMKRLTESRSSLSLRNLLLVFQFGVSIALMIATGAIYLQLRYAMERDPGFNAGNLLTLDNLITRAEVNARKETLKTRLLQLAQVSDATLSSHQPVQTLGLANVSARYSVVGNSGNALAITTLGVDEDFFRTYQTEIVAGRDFSPALDRPGEIFPQQAGAAEPSRIMINVSASRSLGFASPAEAVGKQLRFTSPASGAVHDLTIVGVAADTNFYSLNALPRAEIYSLSPGFTDVLTLRFEGSPRALLSELTQVWRSVMGDAELSTGFVEQNMAGQFGQERVEAYMLLSFSLLAVIIACLGLYGSTAFSMERRTREIGIRKALGAAVSEIIALLTWQFSRPVLFANLIAWPVAVWGMLGWLQRFPYRFDVLILIPLCVLAAAIALSIAWLTIIVNTTRVARASPVHALRYE